MNYDEEVRFGQGSDTGENSSSSIQPVSDNENLVQAVLRRPAEYERIRLEILRNAVRELNFCADYDRVMLASSTGSFRLMRHSGAPTRYSFDAVENLKLVPALIPAFTSGGRSADIGGASMRGARLILAGLPYAGILGANDLHIYAHPQYTGQRAYRDGQDMNLPSVKSVGANDISFRLAQDTTLGVSVIAADPVSGMPTRHISIRYGSAVVLEDLINFINGDRAGGTTQSQGGGTWGIGEMIRAATTVLNPGMVTLNGVNILTVADTVLQGGYDAEVHTVTPAQLVTFFTTAENRLEEGETLAFGYPVGPAELAGGGGRRQSLLDFPASRTGAPFDNSGTWAPGSATLFNTGLYPERIPGAIPIGKILDGTFIFADGTALYPDAADDNFGVSTYLGDPARALSALASLSPAGTMLIGAASSPNWYPDGPPAPPNVPASDLHTYLQTHMSHLTSHTAGEGGSRRIGAEAVAGSSTPGNASTQLDLTVGSIRQQFDQILNKQDGLARLIGLNGRVSEYGHAMRGLAPIYKDFITEAILGGGSFLRATMAISGLTNLWQSASINQENQAFRMLHPMTFTNGAAIYLLPLEEIHRTGAEGEIWRLTLNGPGLAARWASIKAALVCGTPTPGDLTTGVRTVSNSGVDPVALVDIQHIVAYLNVPATPLLSMYYKVHGVGMGGDNVISLLTDVGPLAPPDFSDPGIDWTGATITFFGTLEMGTDTTGQMIRAYHTGNTAFTSIAMRNPYAPILEAFSWHPTGGGYRSVALYQGRMLLWKYGEPVANIRDTDNILTAADKQLLDGQEAGGGGVVDASLSHHHGSNYTMYYRDTERSIKGGSTILASGNAFWIEAGLPRVMHDVGATTAFYDEVDAVADVYPDTIWWEIPDHLQQQVTQRVLETVEVEFEITQTSMGLGMRTLYTAFKGRGIKIPAGLADAAILVDTQPLVGADWDTVYGGQVYCDNVAPVYTVQRVRFTIAIGDLYSLGAGARAAVGITLGARNAHVIDGDSIVAVRFIGGHYGTLHTMP